MFSASSPGLRPWTLLVSFFDGGGGNGDDGGIDVSGGSVCMLVMFPMLCYGDSGDDGGNEVSGGNVCMFFMFPRQLSARGQVLAAADRDVQLPYF